jgi:imidazolonepropionase-like amidohydrolase
VEDFNMGNKIALIGGLLITGKDREAITDPIIIINDSRIESVNKQGDNIKSLKNVKVINTENCTIMPGLIDTHIHLIDDGHANVFIDIFQSGVKRCVQAIEYIKRTLLMGITTIRSGGDGNDWFEMALRDGVKDGILMGPRIFATGYHLTTTGGHAYFLPPWSNLTNCVGMRCDGADGFRKGARTQLSYGADSVKITLGKGLEEPDDSRIQEVTLDEARAAVEEAHKREKLAIGHAMGPDPIMTGINAGINSIVHGFWLNDECAEAMIEKNVFWEPTIRYVWRIAEDGEAANLQEFYVTKAKQAVQAIQERFLKYYKMGLKITLGSDAGGVPLFPHGRNAEELEYMVRLGLDPIDAICIATKNSSECLRVIDEVGTIEKGKKGDIFVVKGDATKDISLIANQDQIKLIMKDGKIYTNID